MAWAGNVDSESADASRQGTTVHQESREESMAPTDRARRTALHAASRPQLCAVCHQPKRGHKCTGVYVPVRQTAANRARIGRAARDAPYLFGVLDCSKEPPTLHGVHGRNDWRPLEMTQPLENWGARAKAAGVSAQEAWNVACEVCEGRGRVDCCYSCNLVYHPRCLTKKTIPRGLKAHEELVCPSCTSSLVSGLEVRHQ